MADISKNVGAILQYRGKYEVVKKSRDNAVQPQHIYVRQAEEQSQMG